MSPLPVGGYPRVLSEDATIAAAKTGKSLARYGDGEYSLCLGGNCVSQRFDARLQRELRTILQAPPGGVLACIPNLDAKLPDNKAKAWKNYRQPRHLGLLNGAVTYGSSFISRPDSAPWIDTPDYWSRVTALWRERAVILVTGHYNELRVAQMDGAAEVREIVAPRQHAYAEVDRIEVEICAAAGDMNDPLVLMCLGPTATVLAARLAKYSLQALDLGHLGMFMRHAGQYHFQQDELISTGYRDELQGQHDRVPKWATDGHKHAPQVRQLIDQLQPKTVLDYGCGKQTLRDALSEEFRIQGYDPGMAATAGMPKPVDLVVCTDVLEHIEPKKLDRVLAHIERVAELAAYFVIATRPAKHVLPSGRNAHLIVQNADWWMERLEAAGFCDFDVLERDDRQLRVLARRRGR
jgi:hypothetical protein